MEPWLKDVSNALAAARRNGDFDAAEQVVLDWMSGQRSKADWYLIHFSTALLAQDCGLNSKAIEYADRILEEFPGDITALHVRSMNLFHLGRLAEAEDVIREALDIAKRDDQSNIFGMTTLLGKILNAQRKPQDALAALSFAESDMLPSDYLVIARQKVLSETYQLLGDTQNSRQHLLFALRSVNVMPNSPAKFLLQNEWRDALSAITIQ